MSREGRKSMSLRPSSRASGNAMGELGVPVFVGEPSPQSWFGRDALLLEPTS
jgi:hypothetical protein